jgi:hypothetical protein
MFSRNKLSSDLKKQAISLGLCEQWQNTWGNPNEQELINKFLHGINFCLAHNYPSNEFIKKNFDEEVLHRNNIYVDCDIQRRNPRQIVVVQGKSTGLIMYDGYNTADVYVRHDSDIVVDCTRMSKIFISVYDNAKVKVIQKDGATVYVYTHGDKCQVEVEGEVMIRKSANKS